MPPKVDFAADESRPQALPADVCRWIMEQLGRTWHAELFIPRMQKRGLEILKGACRRASGDADWVGMCVCDSTILVGLCFILCYIPITLTYHTYVRTNTLTHCAHYDSHGIKSPLVELGRLSGNNQFAGTHECAYRKQGSHGATINKILTRTHFTTSDTEKNATKAFFGDCSSSKRVNHIHQHSSNVISATSARCSCGAGDCSGCTEKFL